MPSKMSLGNCKESKRRSMLRKVPVRGSRSSDLFLLEKELARLQAIGVIQPVRFSDWAAPIVPVLKSDGRVRICGDYKVTINRTARLEKYPLPLAGGKTFSQLDLSHAYP